jgi:L-alanine-DL-glutamate epimerase-like enolase superfamily enzyme
MNREIFARAATWPLKQPFAISRWSYTATHCVQVEVRDGDHVGRGEGVPNRRYAEHAQTALDAIERVRPALEAGLDRHGLMMAMPASAARNAVDAALWDLEAKISGVPAWKRAGLSPPVPVLTSLTVGLDTPERMARNAQRLGAPLIKLKLGREDALRRVVAVRDAVPSTRLVVDANEAWDMGQLVDLAPQLATLGVEMIEQPLPAGDDDGLAKIALPLPVCADESCRTVEDVTRLAPLYDVMNVKLDKCGGLTAGLALAEAIRDAGCRYMVGCMTGTSLSMMPAFLLAQQASYADLDSPPLLRRDWVPAVHYDGGMMSVPPSWGH